MPTKCSGNSLAIVDSDNSFQVPSVFASEHVDLPAVDGCNALQFQPTIEARPTTVLADAPAGMFFAIHLPQNEDPEGSGLRRSLGHRWSLCRKA